MLEMTTVTKVTKWNKITSSCAGLTKYKSYQIQLCAIDISLKLYRINANLRILIGFMCSTTQEIWQTLQ